MKFWIGVASKDHVQRGIDGGFCQLCHGRAAPLKKMSKGDWIIYYSSKESFDGMEPCQQFTAIGEVVGEDIYEFPMTPDFVPHRRDVLFLAAHCIDIRPLINRLSFIRDKGNWGSAFRFGHLEIPRTDFEVIAMKMTGIDPTVAIPGYQMKRHSLVSAVA